MNNQFAENLKKIRKDHHLSQEDLASELNVSRQAISKWESSLAYPEMDKIIALCDKFNLNIDDLLHHDINEIKKEEEGKKKVNKFIDDFLNFITDTVNLFSNMDFKRKIKCLIEQIIIITLLIICSNIIVYFSDYIFNNIFSFLPHFKISLFMSSLFNMISIIICVIFSLIIFIHVFKTRYLDYYNKYKKEINLNNNTNKVVFKDKEENIIIRDPKHSEYRFINGLLKFFIFLIKLFSLMIAIFISFIIILLFIFLIVSFLLYKTKLFFLGLILAIISSIVLITIIFLLILNFIFNRENDKKKMIWSIIFSLGLFGIGLGFIFVGSLNFEMLSNPKELYRTKTSEYVMQDDLFLLIGNVNYIEKDIPNIEITYEYNKYYDLIEYKDKGIDVWLELNNPFPLIKEVIKYLNNNKVINFTNNITINVYASKENIAILKNNWNRYINNLDEIGIMQENYENRIQELEELNYIYQEQLEEYRELLDR